MLLLQIREIKNIQHRNKAKDYFNIILLCHGSATIKDREVCVNYKKILLYLRVETVEDADADAELEGVGEIDTLAEIEVALAVADGVVVTVEQILSETKMANTNKQRVFDGNCKN